LLALVGGGRGDAERRTKSLLELFYFNGGGSSATPMTAQCVSLSGSRLPKRREARRGQSPLPRERENVEKRKVKHKMDSAMTTFFFPVLSLIDLLNPLLSTPTKKMTSPPSNPTSPPGDEPEPKFAPIDAKPAGGQAETNPDDRTVRAYVFSSSSNRDRVFFHLFFFARASVHFPSAIFISRKAY
jgi:hypothetical protein